MRRRTEPLAGRGTPVGDFRLRPTEYKNKKDWLRTVFKKGIECLYIIDEGNVAQDKADGEEDFCRDKKGAETGRFKAEPEC